MNWLIYLGGYLFGWALWNGILGGEKANTNNLFLLVKLLSWTMTWVWICWKFIG